MFPGMPIVLLAFVCEYVDSSLGMGYGTTLTPLLMMLGFDPVQIVPAVLLSELVTGISAGVLHHGFGNVNLRPASWDFRIMITMAFWSAAGAVVAAAATINIPAVLLKSYVGLFGLLVLAMGIMVLVVRGRPVGFSWRNVTIFGLLAAFNKSVSGGGYGPVVTGGQILSGVHSKSAVGIASVAEGLTCLAGFATYLLGGQTIYWALVPWLAIGAIASVPVAAYTVKRVPSEGLTTVIGIAAAIVGVFMFCRVVFYRGYL
jgi:uncharacterized membrane protein YfcA